MLIDIHVHTNRYSPCSTIEPEAAVSRALAMGLDGICFTDHNSNGMREEAAKLAKESGLFIVVGFEALTYEGDILVFGIDEPPAEKMHAAALIEEVNKKNGVAIAAHPFRKNGRSLGEKVKNIKGLAGLESFNGNTPYADNYCSYALSSALKMPSFGGSDAHRTERVGIFATMLPRFEKTESAFIKAIKAGTASPVSNEELVLQYADTAATK